MDRQTFDKSVYLYGSNNSVVMFFLDDYRIDICNPNQLGVFDYQAYQKAENINYSIYRRCNANGFNYLNLSKEELIISGLGIHSWFDVVDKAEFERIFDGVCDLVIEEDLYGQSIHQTTNLISDPNEKPCRKCGKMNNVGAPVCWSFFCGIDNPTT